MFARDNEVLISNLLGKLLLGSHSYQVSLITWAAARRGCVSDSLFSCSYPTTFHKYQDSYSSFSSASSVLEADALNKSMKCIGSNVFGHVYAISPFSSLLFRKADIWSFPSCWHCTGPAHSSSENKAPKPRQVNKHRRKVAAKVLRAFKRTRHF